MLQLMVCRLVPFALLRLCRGRKRLKTAVCLLLTAGAGCFVFACWVVLRQELWRGMFCLVLAMLPHGIVYGFSIWMLVRCIWNAWSERVWRRIHCLAMLGILLGILLENYVNPYILQIFYKFFQ